MATYADLRRAYRHRRQVIPDDLRSTTQWKAINLLRTLLADFSPTVVALYHASDGEIDLMPLVKELWRDGQTVALPRVGQRNHPLSFNIWPPNGPLEPDLLGVPAAMGPEILPSVLVVPCVGYTRSGWRLGRGGGYYDRTIAAMPKPCRVVGVAFTELELPPDYQPAPHDAPLDFIVTGKELIEIRSRNTPVSKPEKPAARVGTRVARLRKSR